MLKLAVINQKGGVGKTTTAATLATIWARDGKRVLAVDMDPQGNLGLMFGIQFDLGRPTVYDVLTGKQEAKLPVGDVVVAAKGGVDVVPSDIRLEALQLEQAPDMLFRLREELSPMEESYDLCVIDCPPTQGMFVQQALMAADRALIPTNAEMCSVAGISQLFETVRVMGGKYMNPGLRVCGIAVTDLERRNQTQVDMLDDIADVARANGVRVYGSAVNSSDPIRTAHNRMTTVASPDADPRWAEALGTRAYEALAAEVLESLEEE